MKEVADSQVGHFFFETLNYIDSLVNQSGILENCIP